MRLPTELYLQDGNSYFGICIKALNTTLRNIFYSYANSHTRSPCGESKKSLIK